MVKKDVILKGKGFILRHFRMSDVKPYFESQKDPSTKKGFMTTIKTLAEAKKKIRSKIAQYKKKKPESEDFVVEVNGGFAGYVSINCMNEKFFEHRGNVGYCTHPKFRNKGITSKAVKLLTDYAMKKYKLVRIEGWCRSFNKASVRVMEKAGFKFEGTLRKNKKRDGKYLDDMVFGKVK